MKKDKTLQELTILDDFMFGAVMMEPENCKALLERVLEIPIDHVEIDIEKSLRYHPEYRGVRLDVLAKDKKGTRYNVEMQASKTSIEKRSRYYHAQMDMDLLLAGTPYEALPESFVIFICNYDPFKKRKYRYRIKNCCPELPELEFEDGLHTIILSNKGDNPHEVPKELVSFLEYTKIATPDDQVESDDDFVNQVQKTIRQIKSSREMGERYMKLQLLLKEERLAGREEGRVEGREEIIFDMVRDGEIPAETGAKRLSYTLEEFQEKLKVYCQENPESI